METKAQYLRRRLHETQSRGQTVVKLQDELLKMLQGLPTNGRAREMLSLLQRNGQRVEKMPSVTVGAELKDRYVGDAAQHKYGTIKTPIEHPPRARGRDAA